jgi:hypothetical protein
VNVYIIRLRCLGGRPLKLVKIGLANDVAKRVGPISTATPFSADVAHSFRFANRAIAYRVERATHTILANYRLNGEWFRVSPTQAANATEQAVRQLDAPSMVSTASGSRARRTRRCCLRRSGQHSLARLQSEAYKIRKRNMNCNTSG